jgi:hypothetical protein
MVNMNVHYKDYLRQWRLRVSFLRIDNQGKLVVPNRSHRRNEIRGHGFAERREKEWELIPVCRLRQNKRGAAKPTINYCW